MIKTFTMGDSEAELAEKFVVEHECSQDFGGGVVISYKFTLTGIGAAITVSCVCGATENVTDYANW